VQVALAPLLDPTAVVPTIGQAMGLVVSDGPDALDVVTQHLKGLRLLLVLDNFEHLLTVASDVGRLVSLCPDVTVLVSSRSPLRVRGEREHVVLPLALPANDAETLDDLRASPAGALVVDRALQISPHLAMGPEQVHALGLLCRQLAGLPLAIELATAHLRLLTPLALLARLEEVSSASGPRDLPARQRTMRATLDWSYGLLTPDQQKLFRLLGTFRAGATVDAVEEVVTGTGTLAAEDVLSSLESLVEHSLMTVRGGRDGQHRIDMLEPIAQYSRSLLVGAEAALAGRAHAAAYLRLAERAAMGYERAEQVSWLARTAADEANRASVARKG
jgi:predicted ATPase